MKFRVQNCGFCKLFAICCMNGTVFAKMETLLVQKCFCGVEHRVVGPTGSKVVSAFAQQYPCSLDRTICLFKKLFCGFLHARMASSRAFARNGVSRFFQSCSEMNSLLMLLWYFNESSETSSLVRSISALYRSMRSTTISTSISESFFCSPRA